MNVVRSPDERSDIRDSSTFGPGFRFAHPGYDSSSHLPPTNSPTPIASTLKNIAPVDNHPSQ